RAHASEKPVQSEHRRGVGGGRDLPSKSGDVLEVDCPLAREALHVAFPLADTPHEQARAKLLILQPLSKEDRLIGRSAHVQTCDNPDDSYRAAAWGCRRYAHNRSMS